MNGCEYLVSVLVPDRVGLLCDITGVVFSLGGNIGLIRQSLLGGAFNLVFIAKFPSQVDQGDVADSIKAKLADADATVSVRKSNAAQSGPALTAGSRFIAVTEGPDRPGTIYAITSYFVAHGANIEEWNVSEDSSRVYYIAQIIVPDSVDFRKLQSGFRQEMAKIGLSAVLCHENIFRATNEIGPIRALLENNAH